MRFVWAGEVSKSFEGDLTINSTMSKNSGFGFKEI